MKYPFKIKDDYVIDLDQIVSAEMCELAKGLKRDCINLLFKTGNEIVISFDTEEECTQKFEELVQDCMELAQQNLESR